MLSIFKANKSEGWVAVLPGAGRVDLAHVLRRPDARPEVRLFQSSPVESDAAEALARLRATHQLRKFRCTTLLHEGEYRLLQTEAMDVPPEEQAEALRWRLKDMVDFPVEDAAVGVLNIPVDQAGTGRQPGVFAVAAARSVIAATMGLFNGAKLPLEAIDIPELALRNVVSLFEEPNRGIACLALVAGGGWLVVTYRGELYLSRRIDVSAAALAAADADRRQTLLERMALELQRSLDNFDRQYRFIPVAGLLVAAEESIEALQPFLTENLYIPVRTLDLAAVADFAAVPELADPAQQARGLLAIGAALRESA